MTTLIQHKPLLPLKWAGSKLGTPVADRVKELFEPYRDTHVWIEPFVGAGGMLFSVDPGRAYCYDWSAEVIGLHQWLRALKDSDFDCSCNWISDRYYEARERFRTLQLEIKKGSIDYDEFFSLMVWLNRACYNGLWRVAGDGLFNVPQGKSNQNKLINPKMPDLRIVGRQYREDWMLISGSFQAAHPFIDESSFTYADPPYYRTHSAYTAKLFTAADQVDLANWLSKLPGIRVASNAAHPEIIKLYEDRGFDIELIEVRRSISSKASTRKPALEMLAIKGVK